MHNTTSKGHLPFLPFSSIFDGKSFTYWLPRLIKGFDRTWLHNLQFFFFYIIFQFYFILIIKIKICLASIKRQKNCEKISVIIVDDASTDGTGRYLKQKKIKVLKGTGSLFWGGAISLGIRHVIKKSNNKKDWIVLINNDVELSDYSISELITLAKKNKRKA